MVTPRRQLGDFGERIAANRLEANGLRIVGRNVRVPGGEIDLLAEEGDDLVFVEVRTRKAADGAANESLGAAKLRRMWRSAMAYCEAWEIDPACARLDVVSIDLDGAGRVVEVFHHRAMEFDSEE
ncbi:MAG: YraN family protein [Dehalococcoidia bacterium]